MLVIIKITLVILLWCSISTQSFDHVKSQFINGKLRNLQKLLRYFSGTVAPTFKVGRVGFGGWFTSPKFPGHAGLFIFKCHRIILTIF